MRDALLAHARTEDHSKCCLHPLDDISKAVDTVIKETDRCLRMHFAATILIPRLLAEVVD
jgi:hypothetical protein